MYKATKLNKRLPLLRKLIDIHGPSGDERKIRDFILWYVKHKMQDWKTQPTILTEKELPGLQDCVVLVFGKPRTALFAHIDTTGYMVGYDNDLVRIGHPKAETGDTLRGYVDKTAVSGPYLEENGKIGTESLLPRGTTMTYQPGLSLDEDGKHLMGPYLDNRLGVFVALQVAESLKDGVIVFSTYEEHQGGLVSFISQYLFQSYGILQALIADITWHTEGVQMGNGVAISLRDSYIPRRQYINRIIKLAAASGIPFQLEVESAGGSDGSEIQKSSTPMDWCFIGAPELDPHTSKEVVHLDDVLAMIQLHQYLMRHL